MSTKTTSQTRKLYKTEASPVTDRERRIIEANATIDNTCPNPDCDKTPVAADLSEDGTLYVVHEEDGVGIEGMTKVGPRGCHIEPENDPTV